MRDNHGKCAIRISGVTITVPQFDGLSYFEFNASGLLRSIDLTLAAETKHGLLFYTDSISTDSYLIVALRDGKIELM